jgi:hypothetical protein
MIVTMNWKGYGSKRPWPILNQHFHEDMKGIVWNIDIPLRIMINILGIFVETGMGSHFFFVHNFTVRNSFVFYLSGKVERRKVIAQKTMATLTSCESAANKGAPDNLRLVKEKLSAASTY